MGEEESSQAAEIPTARWIGFLHEGARGFGKLEGERITEFEGDLFGAHAATGRSHSIAEVQIDLPCRPSMMIALWNNDRAGAAKLSLAIPAEPLWVLKAPGSYRAHGQSIDRPASHDGRIVYEGELGLVLGRTCKNATVEEAAAAIFGVTCVNDVTALELVQKDPAFPQYTRAKSFDTFGVFGPVIATGLSLSGLRVRTLVNGRERQNYGIDQLIFSPAELVSALSKDLTLRAGDLICCGTSLGILPMKANTTVEVVIDGVGTLKNVFDPQAGNSI